MAEAGKLGGCAHFQLGYVVTEIDAAIASFEALGAERIDRIVDMRDDAGREVMIRNLSHLRYGGTEIELIEPRAGWESVYSNWPMGGADIALHHVGFMAAADAQWDDAIDQLTATGAPVAMSIDIPRVRVAYFDTRGQVGHYTEIVQRRTPKA